MVPIPGTVFQSELLRVYSINKILDWSTSANDIKKSGNFPESFTYALKVVNVWVKARNLINWSGTTGSSNITIAKTMILFVFKQSTI